MNIFYLRMQYVFFALLLSACGGSGSSDNRPQRLSQQGKFIDDYQYEVPVAINDGWETSNLIDVSIDAGLIDQLLQNFLDGDYGAMHGILIIKNGKLVLEEYFDGRYGNSSLNMYDRDTLHYINSVTKSFTSTAIGIAIDQGIINSVNDNLVETFFSDYNFLLPDKATINLEHILSMSSGLKWIDYLPDDSSNNFSQMLLVEDRIAYTLDRDFISEPGSVFNYNTGNTQLLGEIISRVSSMQLDAYIEEYIFRPLGIETWSWDKYEFDDVATAGHGLQLKPRDMAKLGQLFLSRGTWQGEQVVSESWVDTSTAALVDTQYDDVEYGYQWWVITFNVNGETLISYNALGYAGQRIQVFPALDMVVVTTAYNEENAGEHANRQLTQYILPAVLP